MIVMAWVAEHVLEKGDGMPIFEDLPQLAMQDPLRRLSGDGKENRGSATKSSNIGIPSRRRPEALTPPHSRESLGVFRSGDEVRH
jgi:hypothetical protein